ncbi:hypothetical protein D3C75_70210 [compost metagenome]
MTLNYGVCPKEATIHKVYRDVAQHTGPVNSGQLYQDANMQLAYNSLIIPKTCNAGSRKTKPGDLPNLKVQTKFAASCAPGVRKISHTFHQQWQVTGKEKGRTANPTLWDDCFFSHQENQYLAATQDNKVALGNPVTYENFVGQPSGDSLGFLRCRRLISLSMDAEINCPVLSPGNFTCSIPSIISCAIRAVTDCDLAFLGPVAMSESNDYRCKTIYTILISLEGLTCKTLWLYLVSYTLIDSRLKMATSRGATNTSGTSIQTVTKDNDMACSHDTQTRPKFVYLFLGTPNEFPDSTPTVLRAEADSEVDARAKFPRWALTFAAQIRTEAPCRLQLFSTDEGFMWVYEQRQSVKESSHA